MRLRLSTTVLALVAASSAFEPVAVSAQTLFEEDFEAGLNAWYFPHGHGHSLVESGDPDRGTVMALETVDRPVIALVRGSENWGDVRIEGEVLFPEDVHNYLGFVYRYDDAGGRSDFGSLYIKGNSSYIRVNPHHDLNVGRTLYEEYRTPLRGDAAITISEWQRFALEVVGGEAHLYVGDMTRPQVTFPLYEGTTGGFGFKPRNPGGAVWIDGLRAERIDGFGYQGPAIPDLDYQPEQLVTEWDVLGPLTGFQPEVETEDFDDSLTIRDGGETLRWEAFDTDLRGAVLTGKVVDYEGDRRVAYFHATVTSDGEGMARLDLSTVDNLAMWLNGEFVGFRSRTNTAWWDMLSNPEHDARWGSVALEDGENHILIRVVGGTYATGGFFIALRPGVS